MTGPYVLGIDLSSHAIDFAYVDETEDTFYCTRGILEGEKAWDRTLTIGNLRNDSIAFENVYLVAIEAPYGRGQSGTLAVLNRVVGALTAVMPARLRQPERCWIVAPHEWKNGLGLKGKPTREDVRRLLRPAHHWESIPDDQNARDAACLALWARNTNARGIAAQLGGDAA